MANITKSYTKLFSLLVFFVLLNSFLTKCDDEENERQKRTIGFLFRSLFDTFQTQRQPAPMVVSYQPQRQKNPQKQPQQQQQEQQSVKSQLLASSKSLVQKKVNLSNPPSHKPPDVELVNPAAPVNPIVSNPNISEEPQTPIHQNPPQVNPDYFPPTAPLPDLPPVINSLPNSQLSQFSNVIPPPGHHPLLPLKAQVMILPFQIHHQSPPPSSLFEPQIPNGPQSFNYQAEIYFHPHGGGVHPQHHQYPARYSPSNGWHDIDEILRKGVQTSAQKGSDSDVNRAHKSVSNPQTQDEIGSNIAPSETNDKDNSIEGRRMDYNSQTYNYDRDYQAQPFIIHHYDSNEASTSINGYSNIYTNENPVQQEYSDQQKIFISPQQNGIGDGVSYSGEEPGSVDLKHYVPQHTTGSINTDESLEERLQKHLKQNEIYLNQNNIYHLNNLVNRNQWIHGLNQHPTKIGRLPDFLNKGYPEQHNYHDSAVSGYGYGPIYKRSNQDYQ